MKLLTRVSLLTFTLIVLGTFTASAMYDPSLGRWINRDPVTENGFIVVSRANTVALRPQLRWGALKRDYIFVGNNPNVYIDPFGLDVTRNGTFAFDPSCTKSFYGINDDDPNHPWEWVPMPGSGVTIPVDGIGWWGPDGKQYGRKIPNMNSCTVMCDSQGYPKSFDCKRDHWWCPKNKPWTPGGGSPDNLPPLPKPGPSPYE
jgi:hypothetical protein